ncbi:hypothetical protein [Deinococcus psychrotolerans]|uniref:hypothetical protein n=1 Tax=Deinococcus psychrotolerans TaxID=2489213 RepID=UPI003B968A96
MPTWEVEVKNDHARSKAAQGGLGFGKIGALEDLKTDSVEQEALEGAGGGEIFDQHHGSRQRLRGGRDVHTVVSSGGSIRTLTVLLTA